MAAVKRLRPGAMMNIQTDTRAVFRSRRSRGPYAAGFMWWDPERAKEFGLLPATDEAKAAFRAKRKAEAARRKARAKAKRDATAARDVGPVRFTFKAKGK
jgi:hypothetical protein